MIAYAVGILYLLGFIYAYNVALNKIAIHHRRRSGLQRIRRDRQQAFLISALWPVVLAIGLLKLRKENKVFKKALEQKGWNIKLPWR